MIVGQNTLLNQYSPTFYIRNITNGQTLTYDSTRKAFVNNTASLGNLSDVSQSINNPLTLQGGQALVYDSISGQWTNSYIDYNTLINKPTGGSGGGSSSFAGLSDTAKPSLPGGYVRWDTTGTQLIYSTTIPASSITGLATVAYTGNFNDLSNKPTSLGTVTSVSVLPHNGVSGTVINSTSTPGITVILGDIMPNSITATSTVYGSNLSGTNTGDQTITLSGDINGSGTGIISTSLSAVNSSIGTYGNATTVPQFTVDATGRILSVTNVPIATSGIGTVTSVAVTGSSDITVTGSPITSAGTIGVSLSTTGVSPNSYGSSTQIPVITVDAHGRITNVTTMPTIAASGSVTSINVSGGTTGLLFSGGPVTTAGTITASGVLGFANGGTNAVSQQSALNSIAGAITSGYYLRGNGVNVTMSALQASDIPLLNQNTTGTSSNVTGIVGTAHGGTNLSSYIANEVFYAGTTTTMVQSPNFMFDGSSTLTIGGLLPISINGATSTITSLASNGNIVLEASSTGSVIIEAAGTGTIQSNSTSQLVIKGNTGLILNGGGNGITMDVISGTGASNKISIVGPIASDYATNLGTNDLPNKYYVDNAISTLATSSGSIKAYQQLVPLSANSTVSIGNQLPAGATILSVKVNIVITDVTASLVVGKAGNTSAYMVSYENDPRTAGLYIAECFVTESASVNIIATVTGTSGSGAAQVIVEYQVA